MQAASGGYLADAEDAGGFGGRQPFPRHEQEQFPVRLRQGAQRSAEIPALRLRVKPGVDRIPVHARPGVRRSGPLAVPEVAPKHVQRYSVQPGQSAAAVVAYDPRARAEGGDEDLGEQVRSSPATGPARLAR